MTLTFSMMQRTFWMKNKKDEVRRTSRLGGGVRLGSDFLI